MAGNADKTNRAVATNRKALRDYFVLDRIEAGIELTGTEVKALRAGLANLTGGFADLDSGEAILRDINISPYEFGNQFNHEADRPRRLLLHRNEIDRLAGRVAQKGLTLIPISLYFRKGRVKVELGVCRGKQTLDKRDDIKRRTADREMGRAIRRR